MRTPVGPLPGATFAPRISPDGLEVVFDTQDNGSIWIAKLSDVTAKRQLTSEGFNRGPMWSGDGKRILYIPTIRTRRLSSGDPPMAQANQNCSQSPPAPLSPGPLEVPASLSFHSALQETMTCGRFRCRRSDVPHLPTSRDLHNTAATIRRTAAGLPMCRQRRGGWKSM